MNARLAGLITIRHRCDCEAATEPPGEDGIEHVFEIDGTEFPWYITEDGPKIRKPAGSLYEVTITILAERVDAIGIELEQ